MKVEPLLSGEQKTALAVRLAAALNGNEASADESAQAEAILRLIIWNGESDITESLAQAAAGNPNTPHSLAWALANDDDRAATPILAAASALSDADLVAIIETTDSFTKMGAIAGRPTVREDVSRSLVERGNEEVAHLLLGNAKAEIPDDAFACMLDRFGQDDRIHQDILNRGVPPSIRQRLANFESKSPDQQSAPKPESETVRTHSASTPIGYLDELSEQDLDEMVSQMIAERSMTASFLVRKLCLGHFDFFCRSLSVTARLPKDDVCRLALEPPPGRMPELWQKSSLAAGWLPVVTAALSALLQIDQRYSKSDVQVFRRNIVDRTLAILKAEKYEMTDGQKNFFRSL